MYFDLGGNIMSNKTKGSKIILVSPDEKLAAKAIQIINELDEKINVYQGSLSEGLKHARREVKNGANIVISRGGTGSLIKRNLKIPVVNIEISSYDIINSIYKAVSYSKEIGIIGFPDFAATYKEVIEIMEETFSARIIIATIKSEREADKAFRELYQLGARVFIGGKMIFDSAKELGCRVIPIVSGREAIIEAIRQAKYLLEVQLREKENTETLKSIIDFAYDGILVVNKEGRITVFNSIIEKMTGISAEDAMGKIADDLIEKIGMINVLKTGETELGEIQEIGKKLVVINRVPIIVEDEILGVVATFQEIEKFEKMERQIRQKLHSKGHVARVKFSNIVGKSKAIVETKEKAIQFSQVDSTILIQGKTGTGKELFVQSIHNASPRRDKPFVAINCAALPESLLESELFGYVEGAFTGARKEGKAGIFELAHGGTVFLDEISEMSPNLQARFLRVLQEKEVVRIGDDKVISVDIRIIAATNRELYEQVKKEKFREDLYYRLCVLMLKLPTLKDRREDVPELAKFFLKQKSVELGKKIESISHEALNKLMLYDWPGNVRHLENVIERSVVLCKGKEIDTDVILEAMGGIAGFEKSVKPSDSIGTDSNDGVLKQMEYEAIKKVLEDMDGNRKLAAEKLGISVTTLWRRLKEFNHNN